MGFKNNKWDVIAKIGSNYKNAPNTKLVYKILFMDFENLNF